jgi:hypothetical protein
VPESDGLVKDVLTSYQLRYDGRAAFVLGKLLISYDRS